VGGITLRVAEPSFAWAWPGGAARLVQFAFLRGAERSVAVVWTNVSVLSNSTVSVVLFALVVAALSW
jgi:hypothetical protein